jgi:hypothetical protein
MVRVTSVKLGAALYIDFGSRRSLRIPTATWVGLWYGQRSRRRCSAAQGPGDCRSGFTNSHFGYHEVKRSSVPDCQNRHNNSPKVGRRRASSGPSGNHTATRIAVIMVREHRRIPQLTVSACRSNPVSARLTLRWKHVNLTGNYTWHTNKQVAKGGFHPLRTTKALFSAPWRT